jgi:signal peptidase I
VVFNYPMDADSPLYRPVDKRENYIKRCQGTPGDTLKLINTQVYINNKAAVTPENSQTSYLIRTNGQELNPEVLYDLHIDPSHGQVNATDLEWIMPRESVPTLKSYSNITYIAPYIQPPGQADLQVFPHDTKLKWNVDNYGPIIIPKKGWTVKLDSTNFIIYERAIKLYENNKLEKRGNDIYINGTKTNQYTFKMDYYWMMGDNRHNSLDSRFWGFVPEDHIVGKALFVWMSWDEQASFMHKIRWERLFMGIK